MDCSTFRANSRPQELREVLIGAARPSGARAGRARPLCLADRGRRARRCAAAARQAPTLGHARPAIAAPGVAHASGTLAPTAQGRTCRTPATPMSEAAWSPGFDAWLHALNRRRLLRRRQAKHRAAERQWIATDDPSDPRGRSCAAGALRGAAGTRRMLSVVMREPTRAAAPRMALVSRAGLDAELARRQSVRAVPSSKPCEPLRAKSSRCFQPTAAWRRMRR